MNHPLQTNLTARIILPVLLLLHTCSYARSINTYQSDPQISLSVTELFDFRDVYAGMYSDVQFYEVSAQGLTSDLVIDARAPFRVSLQCYDAFDQSITLQPISGTIATTRIFVRFFPEHPGKTETTISHSSDGIPDQTVTVSATGVESLIPHNYYHTATGGGSRLKSQLHEIITNHQTQTYGSLWHHFKSTDAGFSGHVWDIYSDTPCEPPPYMYTFNDDQDQGIGGGNEGEYYNREHTMPRSWFGGSIDPMNTDLYHIYPVDKRVNALRDNYPFGEVRNPSNTTNNGSKLGNNNRPGYSGKAFEPIDAYKGDLARAFLYMVTRYHDQIESWTYSQEGMAMLDNNTYPGYERWALGMLLDWHELDPVSQKEINRNNAIYLIQGNRNPFVDHPEFVQRIWADTATTIPYSNLHTHFNLFPNPATDHLTIHGPDQHIFVTLITMYGNAIYYNTTAKTGTQIRLPALTPGPYIVRIESDSSVNHHMLIIKP
jgi:endonuclease I